jgi:hypothetical protein
VRFTEATIALVLRLQRAQVLASTAMPSMALTASTAFGTSADHVMSVTASPFDSRAGRTGSADVSAILPVARHRSWGEHQHRIVGADRGYQKPGLVLRRRRRRHYDAGQMREPGFQHLAGRSCATPRGMRTTTAGWPAANM